jgi:methylenetetrahydrofolate dehydrogenase (NADP+)/methenyltetrahydrofolate cyclohydrolase
MTLVFDGKAHAKLKEAEIAKKVCKLKKAGITPKLAVFLVGNDSASRLYVSIKKKVAEKMGVTLEVRGQGLKVSKEGIIKEIKTLNKDDSVQGIMVQLPLPKSFSKQDRKEIVNAIALEKDVDGLRGDSLFIHPTAAAVMQVVKVAEERLERRFGNVAVVGCRGMVGKPLVKELEKRGYKVSGIHSQTKNITTITKKADMVISAAGVFELIKASMVKSGVVVIDVGAPKGDIAGQVCKKASFISPAPGGVGPLTVAYLLENLVHVAEVKLAKSKKL